MKHLCTVFLFVLGFSVLAQPFGKISVKAGYTISIFSKSKTIFESNNSALGFYAAVEPTLFTFGPHKEFDFNTELACIQKGGQTFEYIYTSV